MKKSDFFFDLPGKLIAQHPLKNRTSSRLLALSGETGEIVDQQFAALPDLLRAGDLLVFNDTRVIPARLLGHKDSGGRIEILVERILDEHRALTQVRASKTPRPGSELHLDNGIKVKLLAKQGGFYELDFRPNRVQDVLESIGHMPLPPYIRRQDIENDRDRYQTVYAVTPGAVAAPTAGLHFDQETLHRLQQKEIQCGFLTLHVGAGTFQPVRVEDLDEHKMHQEWCTINEVLCQQIKNTKQQGGRIIAVGTTSVRALETAAMGGAIKPFSGETDIFIRPGYRFKAVDAMITNFHLSESTLLMLVCAFSGVENIMKAYQHAIIQQYRFFSYGDAMLLTPADK
jgi:S-adenosylmethionine:tRNA ribosyltransferase-isomerase